MFGFGLQVNHRGRRTESPPAIMQREELGDVIQMSGQQLADIIAFVHDPQEQAKFSTVNIPEDAQRMMEHINAEDLRVAHD
jgi:hypothetical protein